MHGESHFHNGFHHKAHLRVRLMMILFNLMVLSGHFTSGGPEVSAISHIKNPLTIIGIFAGIVEISANLVLPWLTDENQAVYLWFLMLFPTVLVITFFAILNWNHGVLYAPSDYKDEGNFVQIHSSQRVSFNELRFDGVNSVTIDSVE